MLSLALLCPVNIRQGTKVAHTTANEASSGPSYSAGSIRKYNPAFGQRSNRPGQLQEQQHQQQQQHQEQQPKEAAGAGSVAAGAAAGPAAGAAACAAASARVGPSVPAEPQHQGKAGHGCFKDNIFEEMETVLELMKTADGMKDRKLLIRHHDEKIEAIRPNGLYTATAAVTHFYKTKKWVDLVYVIPDEEENLETGKLHLDKKFYRVDCTPVPFPPEFTAATKKRKSNGGTHCGWAMYLKDATDIGEDFSKLLDSAEAPQ